MVIRRVLQALLLALAAVAQGEDEPAIFTRVYLDDAAADSTGRIFAIPNSEPDKLLINEWAGWRLAPVPSKTLVHPRLLCRHPNGSVLVLWDEERDCVVTEHNSYSARVRGRLGTRIAPIEQVNVFVDSRDNVWITERNGTIHRITAKGEVRQMHQVPWGKMLKSEPRPRLPLFPLMAAEDAQRRVWFWSGSVGYGSVMPGLLLWDGKTFTHHERLPGLPDHPQISALLCKDDRHLWLSWVTTKVDGDAVSFQRGLAELDLDTLTCKQLPMPAMKSQEGIERLFKDGDDIYGLAYQWEGSGSFWRLHDGKWESLTSSLTANHWGFRRWEMPVVFTPDGIVIPDEFQMQYLPKKGGMPIPLDWRTCFQGFAAKRFFEVPTGGFFLLAHGFAVAQGPLELPPKVTGSSRVSIPSSDDIDSLIKGKAGWERVVRSTGDPIHSLPPELQGMRITSRWQDQEGTIWVLSDLQLYKARDGRVVAVFDSDERHPFLDGRRLENVGVDDAGVALLRTKAHERIESVIDPATTELRTRITGETEYVVVRPRWARPRTTITVTKPSPDSVELDFTNGEGGGGRFAWRLDGGDWNDGPKRVTLQRLSKGEHRVEVVCTNDDLLREAVPAEARWTISAD